jgi:SAM-dependent methyltransferase
MVEKPVEYWGLVGSDLGMHPPPRWWRAYCDGLNRRWLNRALAGRAFHRALKTDMFDEAVGDGVEFTMADRLVGIDLAPSTARMALRRKGWDAAAADVRFLPFADGVFDLVLSLSTLDHFSSAQEISRALREIRRVLTPGGVLAITLDNLSNPWIRLRSVLPWPLLSRSGLVPYFVGATLTRPELLAALNASGFRVRHSTAIMHTPRVLMVPVAGHIGGTLLLRLLGWMEVFGRLPTRYRTGLFLAMIAEADGTAAVPVHNAEQGAAL